MRKRQAGFNLMELTMVLALVGLLAGLTIPSLFEATNRLRVELASKEVFSALYQAKLYAVRHSANVAVKFRTQPNGRVTWSLYRDGDGDGVRNRDIDRGTDPEVQPPRPLQHFGALVHFGFPAGVKPRHPSDPGRRLGRLDDPIRFNNSDLASFSSLGTATPGSVYLTDGRRLLTAVRVNHRAGKISVVEYDIEKEIWR